MNGGNINDRNDSHNVVAPTQVNQNVVHVSTHDTILGRERSNIVNATIQANKGIDEKKAEQINNKFQMEEKTQMQKFLVTVGIIMGCLVALILIFKVIKFVGDKTAATVAPTTTTTTTTSVLDKTTAYVTANSKVRRFSDDNNIMFLLPTGFNVSQHTSGIFIKANISKTPTTFLKGTYHIKAGNIQLTCDDKTLLTYTITEAGIASGSELLKVNDSEYKYYGAEGEMLLVNGTPGHNFAYYLGGTANSLTVAYGESSETQQAISIIGKLEYKKLPNGNIQSGDSVLSPR